MSADVEESSRRRSRWGGKKDAAEPAEGDGENDAPKKRSRWGSKPKESIDPVLLAVQLGLPLATLQHMSADQQQMLPKLKEKIEEIDLLCA